LEKTVSIREHAMVEESALGAQAQADFGEYNLRNSQGRKVKVYFFTMLLSRSRYKYVCFSTSKFFPCAPAAIVVRNLGWRIRSRTPGTNLLDKRSEIGASPNGSIVSSSERTGS